MTQPNAAFRYFSKDLHKGAVIAATHSTINNRNAAEELSCLKEETASAVTLLQSFRDRTSANPKADLKAAFDHIDNALAHSKGMREQVMGSGSDDQTRLHLSMQYFQTVLSDIPQVSFLSSRMIDSFLEIKDALIETRKMLLPVQM